MEHLEQLKQRTNNFEAFNMTTLMGWIRHFDDLGRPINADPNHQWSVFEIDDIFYTVIRSGWLVKIWDRKVPYTYSFNGNTDYCELINLTPDYI